MPVFRRKWLRPEKALVENGTWRALFKCLYLYAFFVSMARKDHQRPPISFVHGAQVKSLLEKQYAPRRAHWHSPLSKKQRTPGPNPHQPPLPSSVAKVKTHYKINRDRMHLQQP
ncbi:hypothetical protein Csa_004195 [Cucumis sativus]|nr:hypothetical protein Csa_004195 [Cucumis sativus]